MLFFEKKEFPLSYSKFKMEVSFIASIFWGHKATNMVFLLKLSKFEIKKLLIHLELNIQNILYGVNLVKT